MSTIWAIASYTFKEHRRHRVFLTILLFGLVLVTAGLIVSSLAVQERIRMLTDLGLASIEMIGLISAIFLTVNLILQEMENRTIYLILAHPVPRFYYLLGRFLGTVGAILSSMAMMVVLHALLLTALGWSDFGFYIPSVIAAFGKVSLMASLALFLSLFATSASAAMAFTLFLWIMGHFTEELRYLAERSANPITKSVIWVFSTLSPNLQAFTLKDFLHANTLPPTSWYAWVAGYCVLYMSASLLLSHFLFLKKEF